MSSLRCCVTVSVLATLVGLMMVTRHAYSGPPNVKDSDALPLSVESISGGTSQRLETTVQWRDREYSVDAGIDIVMNVVLDSEENAHERELALLQLAKLRTQLRGRLCLDELGTMYDTSRELEKQIILTCFLGSRDPRALSIFVRTLDKEQDMKLRLSSASGLSGWNVRRGVAELVELVGSRGTLPQPARMPYVRDNALESFRKANARKGWGFPDEEIRKSVAGRTDLDEEAKGALYAAEIKKWFAENKHRFPDWKLGDPLPEVARAKEQGARKAKE